MAKDPAFLFYSSDFLTGTAFLSNEQVGMYIRALCHIHQQGHLTEKQLKSICGGINEDVFSKFSIDDNGLFFNERLELEIIKRRKHSEKQRENVLKRWNKIDTDVIPPYETGITSVIPLINENENRDIIVSNEVSNIIDKAKKKKNSPVKRTELAKAMSDEEFVREMANKEIYPCLKHDSPLVLLSADHWEQLKKRFPVDGLLIEMVKVYNNWKLKNGGVRRNVNDFSGVQDAWVVDNAMKILNAKNSFTYDKMRKQQLISDDIRQNNPTIVYYEPEPKQPE